MNGEKCPRCHHEDGYPVPQTIIRGEKMVFVCRYCKHRWVKRKMSKSSITGWNIFGLGYLAGIIIGIYEIITKFFKDIKGIISSLIISLREGTFLSWLNVNAEHLVYLGLFFVLIVSCLFYFEK